MYTNIKGGVLAIQTLYLPASTYQFRSPLMQSLGLELGNVNRTDVRTQCRKRQRLDDLIVTTGVLPPPPRRRRLNGEEDHLVPIVEAKQDEWSPDSYLQRGISHGVSHGISASSLSSQYLATYPDSKL